MEQILAQPPSGGRRSAKDKQTELDQAVDVAKRIKKTAQSTAEVAEYFPEIKQRFRLKHIGYANLGKTGAGIELELNPKATISGSEDSPGVLQGDAADLNGPAAGGAATTVEFGPAYSEAGHVIGGTQMTASMLGPDHPEGSSTSKGGALQGVMDVLNSPGTRKFVKGHLLNAQLGGPGKDARNLFPITYAANSLHYHRMEKFVQNEVNGSKYWMHYNVNISGIQVSPGPPFLVKSQLDATAKYLDETGQPKGEGRSLTVQSELNATTATPAMRPPRGERGLRQLTVVDILEAGTTGEATLSVVARTELWKAYQAALEAGNADGPDAYRIAASRFGYGLEEAAAFAIPQMQPDGEGAVTASSEDGRKLIRKLNEQVQP